MAGSVPDGGGNIPEPQKGRNSIAWGKRSAAPGHGPTVILEACRAVTATDDPSDGPTGLPAIFEIETQPGASLGLGC